jgi:1,6-anhydro-N-acetylmuramate kinase
MTPAPTTRLVIGCMTGTSIDALDAAAVRIDGSGLTLRARCERTASWPLGDLAVRLRRAAEQAPMTAGEWSRLALDFGRFHAERLADFARALSARPTLISVHGQTVFHAPPASWQMINAAPIAAALGCPVVFDLRQADLAAGGQGAPITPLADWVLLRDDRESRAIVNLGGFCNITLLPAGGPPEGVRGMDICACNQVLDAAARRALRRPFDEDGAAAESGAAHGPALAELAGILESQRAAGRSLGTGDEAALWVERWAERTSPENLCATACAAIAMSVAAAAEGAGSLILAGGGARNRALVARLTDAAGPAQVRLIDELGVPGDFREAIEMAVLGALCQDRVPITLPEVTGRRAGAVMSGTWCGL